MSDLGSALIQRCSTSDGFVVFYDMQDERFQKGRRKWLIDQMIENGTIVRQLWPRDHRDNRKIFVIAPIGFEVKPYLDRLVGIFEGSTDPGPNLFLVDAFRAPYGEHLRKKPMEKVNAWFDLEYGVFITFSRSRSQSILDYLKMISKQERWNEEVEKES